MIIDNFFDILTLFTTIFGLMGCLFSYTEHPKKGWLYMSGVFLAFLLSDYYWLIYSFVMKEEPAASGMMANFGWNLGYLIMLLGILHIQTDEMRRFFHPLMLIPIPLNLAQFFLYLPYGGLFSNIWDGVICTWIACVCIRDLVYCVRNRKTEGSVCLIRILALVFIICEYGMWTSSCFDWPSTAADPYYYFEFFRCLTLLLMPWGLRRLYRFDDSESYTKSSADLRFQIKLQVVFSIIVFGSCLGGYALAVWMRDILMVSGIGDDSPEVYNIIAITLFVISVFMSLLVMLVLAMIAQRQKQQERETEVEPYKKKGKLNFIVILVITFILMVAVVIYTSSVLYRVSMAGAYELGEDKVKSSAVELENYLNTSKSVLWATADTVDDMVQLGRSTDEICNYIVSQTENQKKLFDENFTGLYAYINGDYLDGLNWVPPEGYDPTERVWYKAAIEGNGEVVIVPPYVDAQTHSVIITFCKCLNGGENVVALDVMVNYIQSVSEKIEVNEKGVGLVIDDVGLIIAHQNQDCVGLNCSEVYSSGFLEEVKAAGDGSFSFDMDGSEYTAFVKNILDIWYTIVIVNRDDLLEDVRSQLAVNIVIFVLIFMIMTFFYYLGYKNEQAYGKKMEEMSVGRQKQEYETRMLKLEKDAADEANKAKSNFLADMSHEIRTPINAVLGMNEMILRESDDRNILEYASNIKTSGNNLLQLINSILDFSKIEDGKMDITPVNYSTASMITYLINSISERAHAKGLELKIEVDPALPSQLHGDDMRVSQVIMNLLTNAVKYTPEGSVSLTMKAEEITEGKVLIYVCVSDTGIGIKDEDRKKLFESFERLDLIRNRNIEGTGLGMSIITKLLELMNSELHVESVYGQGSSFSFKIWQDIKDPAPLGDYSIRVSEYASGEPRDNYHETFHAPKARILIVDDTKMNLIVATNLLKETHLGIDTASSGQEALILARKNAYDVILMDQRMPGIDGTQTLSMLRDQEDGMNHTTPVICLTADAITGARDRYIAEGFSDYLTKPIDAASLERKLLHFIPDDKIEPVTEKDGNAELRAEKEEEFQVLKELGMNIAEAMTYYQNDRELYREIIEEYASESEEKAEKLKSFFEQKDWKNYGILVHSLKSTSKGIGAGALSELAAGLEKAAADGDEAFILQNHATAMQMYSQTVSGIRRELNESGEDDDDESDDLLEFIP